MSRLAWLPRNWLLRLVVLGNALAALLLLLTYLAPYISPQRSYWIALLALGYPFLLLANLLFIAWWGYWRSRVVYLSLGVLLLGAGHFFNFIGLSTGGQAPAKGGIKVVSYNVHYFNALSANSNQEAANHQQVFLEQIAALQPDIFCAQEFSGRSSALTQSARDWMRQQAGLGYEHRGGGSSLALYSKYPILQSGLLTFESSHNAAIFADIALSPRQTVRVYSMHLQSVKLGKDSDEILNKNNLTHLNKQETKEKYKRISSKLHRAFVMRADQAEQLAAHIRTCPHPVILAGDLNDTPLSYAYRQISAHLNDSFWAKGAWLGTTYAGNLPMLRIDYIFASAPIAIHSHQVYPQTRSDHYPVIAWLSLPQ